MPSFVGKSGRCSLPMLTLRTIRTMKASVNGATAVQLMEVAAIAKVAVNNAHKISHAANAWSKLATPGSDHGAREYFVYQGGGEQESGVAHAERAAKQFAAPVLPQSADEQAAGADAEAGGEEDVARCARRRAGSSAESAFPSMRSKHHLPLES